MSHHGDTATLERQRCYATNCPVLWRCGLAGRETPACRCGLAGRDTPDSRPAASAPPGFAGSKAQTSDIAIRTSRANQPSPWE